MLCYITNANIAFISRWNLNQKHFGHYPTQVTVTVQKRSIDVIGQHLQLTNSMSLREHLKSLIIQMSILGRSLQWKSIYPKFACRFVSNNHMLISLLNDVSLQPFVTVRQMLDFYDNKDPQWCFHKDIKYPTVCPIYLIKWPLLGGWKIA